MVDVDVCVVVVVVEEGVSAGDRGSLVQPPRKHQSHHLHK